MKKNINFQELVKTNKIVPYFKKIDISRKYSNFGPLYKQTQKLVKKFLKIRNFNCTFTSSGDASLNAVFRYIKKINPKKKIVICPSFAFFSDVNNILSNGFKPYFVDINNFNLTYNTDLLNKVITKNKKKIAAILYVSPFGYPVSFKMMNDIQKKFKIPVIYDAADTFLNLKEHSAMKEIFITCSFHPTKTFPANESGLILHPKKYDNFFYQIINHRSYNLSKSKINNSIYGFNGKASEYDCAIFLANFKIIKNRRIKLKKINLFFKKNLNKKFKFLPGYGDWVSNKVIFLTKINKKKIKKILNCFNINLYKIWSDKCMHEYDDYADHFKTTMKNSLNCKKMINTFFIDKRFNKSFLKKLCNELNKL